MKIYMEEKNIIHFAARLIEHQLSEAQNAYKKGETSKFDGLRRWHKTQGKIFQICAMALDLTEDRLSKLMDKVFDNIEEYDSSKLTDLINIK